MATLYELTEVSRQLIELFENEEIDEQTLQDTLEAIGVEGKLEDYCKVIRQLEAGEKTDPIIKQAIAIIGEEIAKSRAAKSEQK